MVILLRVPGASDEELARGIAAAEAVFAAAGIEAWRAALGCFARDRWDITGFSGVRPNRRGYGGRCSHARSSGGSSEGLLYGMAGDPSRHPFERETSHYLRRVGGIALNRDICKQFKGDKGFAAAHMSIQS